MTATISGLVTSSSAATACVVIELVIILYQSIGSDCHKKIFKRVVGVVIMNMETRIVARATEIIGDYSMDETRCCPDEHRLRYRWTTRGVLDTPCYISVASSRPCSSSDTAGFWEIGHGCYIQF